MVLPPGFPFTQTALRTFQECPYRFRLRYLERVPWSTWLPEPGLEEVLERGRRFHELARQHYLGLDVAGQAEAAEPALAAWWAALRTAPPDLPPYPRCYPEAGLSIPLGDYRLAARYDLLAAGPAGALIVDWKTGRAPRAEAAWAQDIQTRVYLLVLSEGGAAYNGGRPWDPASLAMLYWHPDGPRQVRLPYSAAQQGADRRAIQALVGEIVARSPDELLPTSDPAGCSHCAYAPLCGRAGAPDEWEEDNDVDLGAGLEAPPF